MAGDGSGDARADSGKFFIPNGFIRIRRGLLDDLGESPLQGSSLQANRSRFDRKCMRAKWFHLKAVAFKFRGDARENYHLFGLQLHQQRHEQALALDALYLAIAQDLLKKHPFVCNVLVDDPQSIVAGGQNEGFPQLPEGFKRSETVEAGGGLLGFNQGRSCCRVAPVRCCSVEGWATFAGIGSGWRSEEGAGSFAPGLPVETPRAEWLRA